MRNPPITPEEAAARGLHALTYPIDPVAEQWVIDNIMADMTKGSIPCAAVKTAEGKIEVWRGSRFVS